MTDGSARTSAFARSPVDAERVGVAAPAASSAAIRTSVASSAAPRPSASNRERHRRNVERLLAHVRPGSAISSSHARRASSRASSRRRSSVFHGPYLGSDGVRAAIFFHSESARTFAPRASSARASTKAEDRPARRSHPMLRTFVGGSRTVMASFASSAAATSRARSLRSKRACPC